MAYFAYVFPCTWEDHCKIGFSRDPLARIAQLHPRWFEFFDLERGFLVEAETEREARDLELALRRPLAAHRAPQPLAVRSAAGGHTEWVRGAASLLQEAVIAFAQRGYRIHVPLSAWLADALRVKCELLYEWSEAQLPIDELEIRDDGIIARRVLRDALDAYAALGMDPAPWVSARILHWYRVRQVATATWHDLR